MASAAILAGGRAKRYGGRDKSALVVDGRSILDRQLTELSPVAGDVMVVVGAGADPGARFSGVSGSAVRVVHDRIPDSGPLGGLDAALAAARDEPLIVVAGDMPFVTAALFGYLLTLAAGADAVVPRTERGYHPLCAVYTRACQGVIGERLESRRLKMIDFLDAVRLRVVTAAELDALGDRHRLLTNVNTPAEYDGIGARAGHEL